MLTQMDLKNTLLFGYELENPSTRESEMLRRKIKQIRRQNDFTGKKKLNNINQSILSVAITRKKTEDLGTSM